MDKHKTNPVKPNGRRKQGFQLFLISVPFLAAYLVFSYLPLFGWTYAFFDYRAGLKLFNTPFAGFKYFTSMVSNSVLKADVLRVLVNTFGISGLGILTSFLPMFFAIALSEIRTNKYRRVVQTITTIPNFISWVIVYSLAFVLFSVNDGVVNKVFVDLGIFESPYNFLASDKHVWLTMWAWGTWKGLGWSSIIYYATITGIDAELFEAATVDGANRIQRIAHITIPSLMPTFSVLLLLSISNFLNNGMDQYYVFQNAMNRQHIEVLDLYVYNRGFVGRDIPFSIAVGILKTLVSVTLLFAANGISKLIRKESIF
ncbi:sugar ABC transporter permease [Spirochaetia bacterium]|nr:sugar ABC transporter permease [Spirochaetia bacterium]